VSLPFVKNATVLYDGNRREKSDMPEKKRTYDEKLNLYPHTFEDALKKIVSVKPPPKEKKDKPTTKRNRTSASTTEV